MRSGLRLASITLSRSTATVEVREYLAMQNWAELLASWSTALREWAILATCHRFELYFVTESEQLDSVCGHLYEMLTALSAQVVVTDSAVLDFDAMTMWTVREDSESADHLCRVAAGLDSLVLGEAQIQGQVISTYTAGLESATIGPVLSALFRSAIRVGKRARTETHISTRAVSMSSVALSIAARYYMSDFENARILVIGAGEMSRLALKALSQRNVKHVTVANRTLARAESVLLNRQWRAIELSNITAMLGEFDVIFSATSAATYVVNESDFVAAQRTRTQAGVQVLIDLALPRDVDPAIRELSNVVLVDVDDLRQGLDLSLEERKQAMPAVNAIIDEEMERWQAEQRELSMRPYVVELRQRAERIRQQEVERTMRFIGGTVDEETREHIHHLSRSLVNKLLHEPTIRIKELAHVDEADIYVSAICDIFGLEVGNLHSNSVSRNHVENDELRGEPSRI